MFDSPEWTGENPPQSQSNQRDPLVGIRFQSVGKVYHYNATGFPNLKAGAWVVVDTARGRQMGQVATLKPPRSHGGPYKRIERLASGRDMAMRHYYEQKELEAMISCRAESAGLKLPIKIVRAEYAFDGQTLTFLYSSDQEERVEVGDLRERLSHLYRARLEFRQISPREVAKILGGMGACGIEERCCSKFLTEFSPISIKHAKEQNLSLNPNDITGMCGRLRCCLVFEYEQYVAAKNRLPKLKSMIGTPSGEGKVVELLHLRDSVKVRVGEGMEGRDLIFHREQLTPLEELRRLQEKALSGTCDKHEGGGCDCGRKGARPGVPGLIADELVDGQPVGDGGEEGQTSAPRQRDPQRDAQIKARQEHVKARLQERQQRREDQRKQLKIKAQNRDAAAAGAPAPAGESQTATPSAERTERTDGTAGRDRSARRDRPQRRDDRRNEPRSGRGGRGDRPQGAAAAAAPAGETPTVQQPDRQNVQNQQGRQGRIDQRGQRRPLARRGADGDRRARPSGDTNSDGASTPSTPPAPPPESQP